MPNEETSPLIEGDKVQWKEARQAAATVKRVIGTHYEIEFETEGPFKGLKMTLPRGALVKMTILDQMAVEAEPQDEFFRSKEQKEKDFQQRFEAEVRRLSDKKGRS